MKWFYDLKLNTKLLGGFMIVAIIAAIIGAVGYMGINSLGKNLDEVAVVRLPSILGLGIVNEAQTAVQRAERTSILLREVTEDQKQRLKIAWDNAEKGWKIYEPLPQTTEEAALWKEFVPAWADWKKEHEKVLSLINAGKIEDAKKESFGSARDTFSAAEKLLGKITDINVKVAEEEDKAANAQQSKSTYLMIVATLIGFVLAIGLGLIITRAIKTQLGGEPGYVAEIAGKVSQGDLTLDIDTKGKHEASVVMAMGNMLEKLKAVVGEVKSSADNVASGSQELSASSEQMSQGATEQASSVEEVSSSMEQMVSNIRQNSDNAQQTEKIALKSATDAKESGKSVSETVSAMKEIAGKISIIEEIARQTNLLALNAAIEAARAGEHGKGFAVVASEVRKLAERSQAAAGEISHLSSSSVQIAERAGEMLAKLVPDIQKTAELVQEINGASNEQNAGADQINRAIQQLDQVIQQNAGASEEMASTSEELSSQAEQLQGAIAFFKVDDTGRNAHRAQAVRHVVHKPAGKTATAYLKKAIAKPVKAATAAKTAGVAIDMGNGHDKLDDEFEKF
jgi:methyl-accepting chemotaxis protein